jgi:molybdate transport system ATP-binding protein
MAGAAGERGLGAVTLLVALRHHFPGAHIDIAFEVPAAGVTALFGPSGAGKSTILAAAAGLLRPDACRVVVDGAILADTGAGIWLPPERRRVGLVFQDARLFPHMSVATNLRYGLRRAASGGIGFDGVVELLGIAPLLRRRPHTLSGGERQRVAIGRALLAQPHLLLMDEPLASLDAARKAEILPYLARLHATLQLPVLYVTHAFEEIVELADTLVLLDAGRVVACGPLTEIAARADLPLAQRDDAGAVLTCRVAGHDIARGLTHLSCGDIFLLVPLLDAMPGAVVRVRIPAREVILARPSIKPFHDAISLHNILPGRVRAVGIDAARRGAMVEVALAGAALLARVTPDAVNRLGLGAGAPVLALVKSMSVEVLGAGRISCG